MCVICAYVFVNIKMFIEVGNERNCGANFHVVIKSIRIARFCWRQLRWDQFDQVPTERVTELGAHYFKSTTVRK